jgi:hypothetical protein
MALQIRRGLESARTSITPAEGEVLYVTDTKRVYIGDGSTLGGNQVGGNLLFPIIDNIKLGYATTATAGGTTTLTATSGRQQLFTGSTTQTIVLPVTSTLALGVSYEIENLSTGNLTVQSSGTNTIGTIPPGVTAHLLCISTSLTTAAAWDMDYIGFATLTGTGNAVLATSPTISGLTLTGTLTAGGGVGTSGQYLQSTGTGVQWAAAGGSVVAGTGISVSGSTVSLATSGASAGTYGNSYSSGSYIYMPQFTVDSYGRITSVTTNYVTLGGGGGGGNSFANIYAGATGTVSSPSPTGATMITASSSSDYLYLVAGSNVTITGSNSGNKAIMISATGGGSSGGALTFSTTTSSFNQGSTSITYPSGITTTGGRVFVAFFGYNMSNSWISYPMDPSMMWNYMGSGSFYVYYATTTSTAPSSQMWTFNNNGHMIYTTWIVPSTSYYNISNPYPSGSSWMLNVSSSNNKTHTVLIGSGTSSFDVTTAIITAPSGYTSVGSKKHPTDTQISVIAYQNATPPTMTSQNWSITNPNYNSFSVASVETGAMP